MSDKEKFRRYLESIKMRPSQLHIKCIKEHEKHPELAHLSAPCAKTIDNAYVGKNISTDTMFFIATILEKHTNEIFDMP